MRQQVTLLLFLMFPALLVDAVNGWMIRNLVSAISLSQVYRLSLLGLMLLWLARYRHRYFVVILGCFTILTLDSLYHSQFYRGLSWMVADFHFHIRMILHFVYFLFFWSLIRQIQDKAGMQEYFIRWVRRLFVFSFLVVAANIVMGTMGIGYSTVAKFAVGDDEGYGGLGFFKAGNDVSATYLVIIGFVFYLIWEKGKTLWRYALFGLFSLLLAVLLQTKAIILGTMLLFVGVPAVLSFSFRHNWKVNRRLMSLLLLGGGAIALAITWLLTSNAGIIARFMFFYEKAGLIFALLTGRSYFLDLAVEVFINNFGFFDVLFGHGWSYYLQEMGGLYNREKLVEIDYVDIFMINGLTGLGIELAFWAFYLSVAFKGARTSSLCRVVLLIDVLMLGIAGMAGHVLYSTVNCMFIGLLNALPLMERAVVRKGVAGENSGGGDVASSAQRQ